MAEDKIIIKGARQHNLKNIDIEIPRNELVVITGLSGSGKSSLAFDTIYAEGQRRYVESLSAYARQFLGQMDKPDVDYITGLSPAISIDQKTTSKNPRSTVGTVTEIYDYMRLLFARIGVPHCYKCGKPIVSQTVEEIVDTVMDMEERTRIMVMAPVVRGRKGEYKALFEKLRRDGYVRVRVDGQERETSEEITLDRYKQHTIEVIIDRLIIKPDIQSRLADSIETALKLSEGIVTISVVDGEELTFSEKFSCIDCGISLEELTPRSFSFNSPYGACPECAGLGETIEPDPERFLNMNLSILEGGVIPWSDRGRYYPTLLKATAEHYGIDLNTPLGKLSKEDIDLLLYGGDDEIRFKYTNTFGRTRWHSTRFKGLITYLDDRYKETESDSSRTTLENYMAAKPCQACKGDRLKPESLAVTVGGVSIAQLGQMPIGELQEFFHTIHLSNRDRIIAQQILKEIEERLGFLINVGLDYLTLGRAAGTLSGGEAQRIRLATQIGSGLVGVLYILDEPSIGLHQRDNKRLLKTLEDLRDLGNTLIVVEHDEETIRSADHIIDMGPGAGANGGYVVAAGSLDDIVAKEASITGQYLSGKTSIPIPQTRRESNGSYLEIQGAREHNLKDINVTFPLGTFICVTGVSGSGKSTLVNEILYKALAQKLYRSLDKPGAYDEIIGLKNVEKVINIDQSPIGRTPRSNPATYTKAFDGIRSLFAETPMAKMRGYMPGRFSFNVKGGRCEACRGDGIIKIEMHFLPDVYVPCEVCKGQRYNRETLEVKYKGKNIAEVLDMQVAEALDFFENIPAIRRKLETINDVGLGYIKLGQPATTLSGGEAQRVKLASELSKRGNGGTIYILDEPTTGLHFADVKKLIEVLERLVETGATVVVIEHNLDVIKTADYIIDLGPEGGDKGGQVVATGTPEEVARNPLSYTGQFLNMVLRGEDLGTQRKAGIATG
jgi:excinuclease ABC subunit A